MATPRADADDAEGEADNRDSAWTSRATWNGVLSGSEPTQSTIPTLAHIAVLIVAVQWRGYVVIER